MTQFHTNNIKQSFAPTLAVMYVLYFIVAFITGLQNPLGVIVKSEFALTNFQSQLGNMSSFLAYLLMGIPAGKLLQRIGYKKTALIALITGFSGLCILYFSGEIDNFVIYLSGALVCGFAMCMLNTVINPMFSILGSPDRANQRLNLAGTSFSIGATMVPILGGLLMGESAQRSITDLSPMMGLVMGIIAVMFISVIFVYIPEPHIIKHDTEKKKDHHSPISFRHFVLGMFSVFIYLGVEVGIPNVANLYMTNGIEHGGLGLETAVAGGVVGTYWFLMLIGRFVGFTLGGIFTNRQMLFTVSLTAVCLVLAAMVTPVTNIVQIPVVTKTLGINMVDIPLNLVFLVLCGLCTSLMFAAIFSLATAGLGKYMAIASGYFMMMLVGGGVLPLIQGAAADHFGYLNSYWIVIAGFIYLFYYSYWGSRNVNPEINVE